MKRLLLISAALFAGLSAYMTSALVKNSAYANFFWLLIGISLATTMVAQTSLKEAEEVRTSGAAR